MTYHPHRRPGLDEPLDVLAQAQHIADLQRDPSAVSTSLELEVFTGKRFDALGRRISRQQTPGFHKGVAPKNKGKEYKPTPPSVAECMAMLNACATNPHGRRLYAALILLWQGALRCFEALALTEDDIDETSGSILVRHGKGDKTATIKMAAWAWPFLAEWRDIRATLADPHGPLICVIGPGRGGACATTGQALATTQMRSQVRAIARAAGVKRRCAPHQLRHAWAVQAYTAGVPLRAIQLHLRHENIGITDTYLQGLGVGVSHDQVYQQSVPLIPATELLTAMAGDRR
jgi:integrase